MTTLESVRIGARLRHGVCIALVAAATRQVAAAPVDLARVVPEGTVIYLGWSGSDPLRPATAATAWGKTLADPQVERLIREVRDALDTFLQAQAANENAAEEYAAAKRALDTLWRRPTALAVIDAALGPEGPSVQAALLCHVGNAGERFMKDLDALLRLGDVPVGDPVTIAGKRFRPIALPIPLEVFYGLIDEHFVLAVGRDTVTAIAQRIAGGPGSLAQGGPLTAARKKIGGTDQTRATCFYLDVAGLLKRIQPLLPLMTGGDPEAAQTISKFIAAAGYDSAQALTWETHMRDGGCVNGVYLQTAGGRRGFLDMIAETPLTDADLGVIPKNVKWAMAWNLDLTQIYKGFISLFQAIDPTVHGVISGGIAQFEEAIGLRIERDLLGPLGDTLVVYDVPDNGGLWFTGITVVAETTDAPQLRKTLRRIVEAIAEEVAGADTVTVSVTEYRDHRIEFVNAKGLPVPVAPAWAVHENRLVVGLYPQIVMTALDQMIDGRPERDSILAHPDVVRATKILGRPGPGFTFVDIKRDVAGMYPWLLLFAQMGAAMIQGEGVDIDITALPRANAFTQYMFGQVRVVKADDDGILDLSHGPLPIRMPEFGGSAVMVWAMSMPALLPSLARARELSKRTVCMANLQGIGNVCHFYANEHDDRFPPDLQTLVREGEISEGMLQCPSAPPGVESYVYVPGLTNGSDPRYVLAYERLENHAHEGVSVLFADGHAEWMDSFDFEEALARTKKALEEVKRRD